MKPKPLEGLLRNIGPETSDPEKGMGPEATAAEKELWELVYPELHAAAHRKIANEPHDLMLKTTALVSEVFIRITGTLRTGKVLSQSLFFGVATKAMRDILIDRARERKSKKRGAGMEHIVADEILDEVEADGIQYMALHRALDELQQMNSRQHDVIMLHYFQKTKVREIADNLEVSVSTVEKDLQFAKAFIYRRINEV